MSQEKKKIARISVAPQSAQNYHAKLYRRREASNVEKFLVHA